MIIASINSKKKLFHYSTCRYAANIESNSIIYFHDKDDARNNGYTHCPYCSKLIKYYNQDQKSIDDFLKKNDLKMYIDDDSMYIENTFSAWKITIESDNYNLELFHANSEYYNQLEKKNGHIIHHYHKQKYIGQRDILSMLQYIIEHDKWKTNHLESYKRLSHKTKEYKKAREIAKKTELRNLYNLIEKIGIDLKENENNKK